jgi:hypothetical protein
MPDRTRHINSAAVVQRKTGLALQAGYPLDAERRRINPARRVAVILQGEWYKCITKYITSKTNRLFIDKITGDY